MKKKILAIIVSMLFIAMIPSTIGDDCKPDQKDEWIYMRGIMSYVFQKGNPYRNLYPIHFVIWYKIPEGLQRRTYWVEFPLDAILFLASHPYMRMYEIGLGLITYFSTFNRGLEPLE